MVVFARAVVQKQKQKIKNSRGRQGATQRRSEVSSVRRSWDTTEALSISYKLTKPMPTL